MATQGERMQGQFALTFVDLTAYLLPGLVVLISLAWLTQHQDAYQNANLLKTIALLGASYILGILIHRLSFVLVYPSDTFTGRSPIEHVLSRIPEIDLVATSMSKRLNIANLGR